MSTDVVALLNGALIKVDRFMKGLSTGDSNVANVGLRRFFEQKFNETGES